MIAKKIIGRKEFISIIDLGLYEIKAKVDTGADSNSMHCDHLFVDDSNFVHFKLLNEMGKSNSGRKIKMPLYRIKKIKSSNGEIQYRPSIKVTVSFFGKKYKTVVSLSDRSDMKCPMLIGRKFLSGRFLVDVSQEYIACKMQKEKV